MVKKYGVMNKRSELLRWNVHITERTKDRDGNLTIKGIAVSESVSRNGITYLVEELEKVPTLVGIPMLLDHRNETDAIVGRVVNSGFNSIVKGIEFEAFISDDVTKDKIRNGIFTDISIGATVQELEEDKDDNGNKRVIARGIEIVELSLVAVPGVKGQGFTFHEVIRKQLEIREAYMRELKEMGTKNPYNDMQEEVEVENEEEDVDDMNSIDKTDERTITITIDLEDEVKAEVQRLLGEQQDEEHFKMIKKEVDAEVKRLEKKQ